jgi:hypothetical protein
MVLHDSEQMLPRISGPGVVDFVCASPHEDRVGVTMVTECLPEVYRGKVIRQSVPISEVQIVRPGIVLEYNGWSWTDEGVVYVCD